MAAAPETDQAIVECVAPDENACTLTPRCRLKLLLVDANAASIADLTRRTLADCIYRPESA